MDKYDEAIEFLTERPSEIEWYWESPNTVVLVVYSNLSHRQDVQDVLKEKVRIKETYAAVSQRFD